MLFHHIVENSILYKKDIQQFCIGPILFSENKIIRSVVGGKVDGQILSGTRSEKPKILSGTRNEKRKNLFGTKWQFRKILLGSQRVNRCKHAQMQYNQVMNKVNLYTCTNLDRSSKKFDALESLKSFGSLPASSEADVRASARRDKLKDEQTTADHSIGAI